MVQTLVPALGTLGEQIGASLALYVAFVLAFLRLTESVSAYRPRPDLPRRRGPVLPSIVLGSLIGLAAVQLLPWMFPDSDLLMPLRHASLAARA